MAPFTIALPAGRLAGESIDFFRKCNFADFEIPEKTRELMFEDRSGQFRVIMVRSQDVPTYVLSGAADAGIAGRDVLAERGYDITVPMELKFGECHLSLAAPESSYKTLLEKPHLRVATKYPRLTNDFFFIAALIFACGGTILMFSTGLFNTIYSLKGISTSLAEKLVV